MKEKSKWFSSLRDLTRKLKVIISLLKYTVFCIARKLHQLIKFTQQIMKMEQIKLSEEATAYKKCLQDVNNISASIQSKSKLTYVSLNTFI